MMNSNIKSSIGYVQLDLVRDACTEGHGGKLSETLPTGGALST